MTQMIRQTAFTVGEVDAINYRRTDLQSYLNGAQNLKNMEVSAIALCKKRRGTGLEAIVTEYSELTSKTFEFIDKNQNYYLIIASNLAFHIFTNGKTFLQTLVSPYTSAELAQLDYANDFDSLIFVHNNHPPSRLTVSSYTPSVVFTFETITVYPSPSYDFGKVPYSTATVNLSVSTNILTFELFGYSSDPGFTNDWVGGSIVGGGATDIDPIGYAIIQTVSYSAGTVTFTALIQIGFLETGFATQGSQYSIRQNAFGANVGYPSRVAYYQSRLWYANTQSLPNTLFGSKINAPDNLDVGIGRDTDAIIVTLGQENAGGIVGINGGKQLEVYTRNFEFVAPQYINNALTPSTFSVRQQSAFGSSGLCKPTTYSNDSYYVTKTGRAIIKFTYMGIGQDYLSTNVSMQAVHLVKNPIKRALVRGSENSQDNFIYYLNADGSVTAFQFSAQAQYSNQPQLAALTPLEFGNPTSESATNPVQIVDICTINNQLFFLKYYTLTEVFALEAFDENIKLDSFVNTTMTEDGEITGLDNLNGYTVGVVFEGQDLGEYPVVDGAITVSNPPEAGDVTVGLNYDVLITPMYIYAGPNATDYFKDVTEIYVDYYQSLNFEINGYLVPYQQFAVDDEFVPIAPQDGTAIISMSNGWARSQTFNITQHSPFDLQIVSIGYQEVASII